MNGARLNRLRSQATGPGMHLSVATQFVLESLLADPHRELPGRELIRSGAFRLPGAGGEGGTEQGEENAVAHRSVG